MTLLVDAGPLIAAADRRDPLRETVQRFLVSEPGPLVVPAPVTAEVDYLIGRRLGAGPRHAFMEDLAAARFSVACLEDSDYAAVVRLNRQYADLRLGLADLSLVALAGRLNTTRLLTFDEGHFRAVKPLQGGTFTVLPADGDE